MKRSNITRNRKEYLIRKLEFSYDESNDLLYVYKRKASVYTNVMIGEFHIEFDKGGEVVGVEVLRASDLLGEYGISRKILENIKEATLKVVVKGNSLLIFLMVSALNEEKTATITLNNVESKIMKSVAEA
jgi:uncharacterized protein YuzE